jgi:hypothetical protein
LISNVFISDSWDLLFSKLYLRWTWSACCFFNLFSSISEIIKLTCCMFVYLFDGV